MEPCYNLRRAFALALALVVVASAATAAAQYMYLDANGDGVHTPADVLAPGGTATFDVWLVTDHNRDGTAAVCAQDPSAQLTINSYTFILSATGGSVRWGLENRMPEFNLEISGGSTPNEFWGGWLGTTILPPGTYRLATVNVMVDSGTPSIWIEATPRNLAAIAMTSFGCLCLAHDFDNTMVLGFDWFDVDGLPYGAAGNTPPALQRPSPMTVAEGGIAEQILQASDADGQPLSFGTSSGFPWVTVTTTDPGAGTATGLVRLTPGYTDAGKVSPIILAGDGVSQAGAAMPVLVTETARAPALLSAPTDMTVPQGLTRFQELEARDPDGGFETSFVKVAGPDFVHTLTTSRGWGVASGRVEVSPGFPDTVGNYDATIAASDGVASSEASFRITVTPGNHPPQVAEYQPEVSVTPGTLRSVFITATDAEGSPLTFSSWYNPPFVSVTTLDPGTGTGTARVDLRPTKYDTGEWPMRILVSDGEATSFTTLPVRVSADAAPILNPIANMIALEGTVVTQEILANDPDAEALSFQPIDFFPFMRLEAISSGPYEARARIVLAPKEGDRGSAVVSVQVSDGALEAYAPFSIQVLQPHAGSTMVLVRREPSPPGDWATLQFRSDEANISASARDGSISVTLEPPPPKPDGSAWGPAVQLACLPAQRPDCISARVYRSTRSFSPPPGGTLAPGRYAANIPQGAGFCLRSDCSTQCPPGAEFEIKQLAYDPSGQVTAFWAIYEYALSGIRYHGEVRFNAALPVWIEGPSRTQAHAGAPIMIPLRIGGTGADPPFLRSPDLPAGASVSLDGSGGAAFTWTPGLDQTGLWNTHIIAERSDAVPDTFSMLVCVDLPGRVTAVLDVNRLETVVTNRGVTEDSPDNKPGVFHPRGSGIPVAQTIGLVLAGAVNGQVRAALPWRDAYHAGPLTHGAAVPFEPRFKNYTIKRGDVSSYDWTNWPSDLGAPRDASGNPLLRGDMTIWSVYNDGASTWEPSDPPRPTLDVEVRQTTWGTATQDRLGDVVFQKFRIRNAGVNEIRNAYAGLYVNPVTYEYLGHVGSPYRDLTGCDTTLAMGYGYTGSVPYLDGRNAVGVVLLSGPEVIGPGGLPHRLGFTALQDAPNSSQDPATAYYQLQGLKRDGTPRHERDDPTAPITAYAYTGDPVMGTGWLQTNNYYFGSTFFVSTGPFDLLPGQEQQVDIAIVGATGGDNLDAVVRLRTAAEAARSAYVDGAPIADAGGPYAGYEDVPIAFDGSRSSDPDGEALIYAWEFGDGVSATGSQPLHTFAEPGIYVANLAVSDGSLAARDTTSVTVAAVDSASAWLAKSDQIVRLQSSRPLVRILLQPTSSGFEPEEVVGSSVTLERDDGSAAPITAVSDKTLEWTDANRDGISEMGLLFRKSDVRLLLADAPAGRSIVPMTIRGALTGGGRFVAPVALTVEAGHGHLGAFVAPNPFNPTSTITFRTTRSGPACVRMFDVTGRLVRVLLDEKSSPAGYHDVAIADAPEKRLPSGVYFYRIETPEGEAMGRLVVLK